LKIECRLSGTPPAYLRLQLFVKDVNISPLLLFKRIAMFNKCLYLDLLTFKKGIAEC